MDKMLSTSVFFGVFVSIAGYEIGLLLKEPAWIMKVITRARNI